LELRADLFKSQDPAYIIAQIKKRKSLKIPLLLTFRNQKKEGAAKIFSDRKKWQIITTCLPLVDMVDIELSSPLLNKVVAEARHRWVKVIVSSHYLKNTPLDLEAVYSRSLSAGADIVKIAVKANSFDDLKVLLDFTYRHRKENLITMCLGPKGAISRLLFPAAGSRYTYTFLNKPTASGQVDIETLKSHMKVYYSFSF
jgi:3-dehydroquinate dehydratase-1